MEAGGALWPLAPAGIALFQFRLGGLLFLDQADPFVTRERILDKPSQSDLHRFDFLPQLIVGEVGKNHGRPHAFANHSKQNGADEGLVDAWSSCRHVAGVGKLRSMRQLARNANKVRETMQAFIERQSET